MSDETKLRLVPKREPVLTSIRIAPSIKPGWLVVEVTHGLARVVILCDEVNLIDLRPPEPATPRDGLHVGADVPHPGGSPSVGQGPS